MPAPWTRRGRGGTLRAVTILTTHVGSLPRPDDITPLLIDREHGVRFDRAEFDAAMAAAVVDVVALQRDAGIDIVSDGEMSKITYSTYVKDRMTGFGGDTPRLPALDLAPYPELRSRMAAAERWLAVVRPSVVHRSGGLRRARRPRRRHRRSAGGGRRSRRPASVRERRVAGARHRLPAERALPHARRLPRRGRRGDARRVRGDRRRRVPGADRLPRPGDGAPHRVPGVERRRVRGAGRAPRRRAQPRDAQHRARVDADAPVLGQLRRPARPRHPARRGAPGRAARTTRRRSCSRPPTHGTPTSGRCGHRRPSPTTRCSHRAWWCRPATTSIIHATSPSCSAGTSRSSARTG